MRASSKSETYVTRTQGLSIPPRSRISFLSKHKLPEKGFETKTGSLKAYSTVLGGILYMMVGVNIYTLVLSSQQREQPTLFWRYF